jgi:hypothetical protein
VITASQGSDEAEDLVQEKRDSFYITAVSCEDGFVDAGVACCILEHQSVFGHPLRARGLKLKPRPLGKSRQ